MKKSKYKNTCEDYSISKVLRDQKRSNEYFELMLNNITLEELIALKLELTYKNIGTPLYGIPLFRVLHSIVQDAVFKFACSVTPSRYKARIFLGMDNTQFYELLKRYNTEEYLLPKEKKGHDN